MTAQRSTRIVVMALVVGLAGARHALAQGGPSVVRALALVTRNRPPQPWTPLSRIEPADEGAHPHSLVVQYSWARDGGIGLYVACDVHDWRGIAADVEAKHGLFIRGDGLVSVGWALRASPPQNLDEGAPLYPGDVFANPEALGRTVLTMGEPLASAALLANEGNLSAEDMGDDWLDGRPVRKVRLTPRRPVRFYHPHVLGAFALWIDDGRKVVLQVEGYNEAGERVMRLRSQEVREVGPGKWAVVRAAEWTEPGTLVRHVSVHVQANDKPPEVREHDVPISIPGYREIIEMAVIGEGVVVPKRIRRYDDRDRLLMQAEFLSYEIEYDDGTVVYAEPE